MPSRQTDLKYSELGVLKLSQTEKAKFPFYHLSIDKKLVPETRELLAEYSHVPPQQQSEHVHRIRDLAWDIRSYPCTGIGAWLTPQLYKLPIYPEIVERLKGGEILMDVGCFLGHDLRRLVRDGVPSKNIYGVDIVSHWDVGFEMFRDRDHFFAHFIEADFLSGHPALMALKGKVDIVAILQVLHQWNWHEQLEAAKVLVTFTKLTSLIVGNQLGNAKSQEVRFQEGAVPIFHHNSESFAKMWDQVGTETGTKWETQAWLRPLEEIAEGWNTKEDAGFLEEGVEMMEFIIKRVK